MPKRVNFSLQSDEPDTLLGKKGDMLYNKIVSAGEEFTIHGLGKDGKLDTNIYINGIALHTSCSKPIGTGMHIGTFTITAGESVKGGALCTIENFENKDKKKKKEK